MSICREVLFRDRLLWNVICIGLIEKEDGEEEKFV